MNACPQTNNSKPERGEEPMKEMHNKLREELWDLADGLTLLWALARESRQERDEDYSLFETDDR